MIRVSSFNILKKLGLAGIWREEVGSLMGYKRLYEDRTLLLLHCATKSDRIIAVLFQERSIKKRPMSQSVIVSDCLRVQGHG
jgi:hypothetical protein